MEIIFASAPESVFSFLRLYNEIRYFIVRATNKIYISVAQCQRDFEHYYMQLKRQEYEFQNTQYMMNSWNHGDCQMYPANYYSHDPEDEILGQLDSMDIGEPVRGGVMQAVTTTRGPADEESNIQQNMSMSTDGTGNTRQSQSDSSTLHSENEKTTDEADEKSEVLIEKWIEVSKQYY